MAKPRPTADDMRAQYSYDPDTGVVAMLRGKKGHPAGPVGSLCRGYLRMHFEGRYYFNHRVAWLLMTGDWPPEGHEIDHINRQPADNRWINLRVATRTQNTVNSLGRRKKLHPELPRGVFLCTDETRHNLARPYRVLVRGKHHGYFSDVESAARAAEIAREKLYGKDWQPMKGTT